MDDRKKQKSDKQDQNPRQGGHGSNHQDPRQGSHGSNHQDPRQGGHSSNNHQDPQQQQQQQHDIPKGCFHRQMSS